jgi:hypothetical protein
MSDIADKIYAATGLVLGTETAAAMERFIKQEKREALEEAARVAEELIGRAYRIGFGEGMKEDRSFKGGIPWHDSATKKEGAAAIRAMKGEGHD